MFFYNRKFKNFVKLICLIYLIVFVCLGFIYDKKQKKTIRYGYILSELSLFILV